MGLTEFSGVALGVTDVDVDPELARIAEVIKGWIPSSADTETLAANFNGAETASGRRTIQVGRGTKEIVVETRGSKPRRDLNVNQDQQEPEERIEGTLTLAR